MAGKKKELAYLQAQVPDTQGEFINYRGRNSGVAERLSRSQQDGAAYLRQHVPDVQGEFASYSPKRRSSDVSYLKAAIPEKQGEYMNYRAAARRSEASHLKLPPPGIQDKARLLKIEWLGLNKTQEIDTGELSAQCNISSDYAPYLSPSQRRIAVKSGYAEPIGLFGFEGILLIVYAKGNSIYLDYIKGDKTYTGLLNNNGDKSRRSIVRFNVYDNPNDPILGSYIKKLVIFPDKKTIDFDISANFTPAYITNMPDIKYAAVHLSRLFGVDDGRIYASGFNDYANWSLDTADEYNAANAWCSPAQSNVKASGSFTGITVYDNHVICFKSDYIQELYNNKNPFRIMDIYHEGAIDGRSIAEAGGRLFFASGDGIKIYTGGNPRVMSYKLNLGRITKAVAGTDKRKYYCYCGTKGREHNLFVYDTQNDTWCEEGVDAEIISFAYNGEGMYALTVKGEIVRVDSGDYGHEWFAETDLFLNKTVDVKRLQKLQVLADMEPGSRLDIVCIYDSGQAERADGDNKAFNGEREHIVYSETNTSAAMRRVPIRIVPRQTSNYSLKLRLGGYGMVKLYQLEAYIKDGGELYV